MPADPGIDDDEQIAALSEMHNFFLRLQIAGFSERQALEVVIGMFNNNTSGNDK